MTLRDSLSPEAKHAEKIKNGSEKFRYKCNCNEWLRIARLICKHIPNLIKPRARGPCAIHKCPRLPGFLRNFLVQEPNRSHRSLFWAAPTGLYANLHECSAHWVRMSEFAYLSLPLHCEFLNSTNSFHFYNYLLSICYVLWGQVFTFESLKRQSCGRCSQNV